MDPQPDRLDESWHRAIAVVAHPDDLEYGAASANNRAEFRIVVLGNPVAGESKDERFETWIQQTEVPLLDLSPLWSDRSNLISREYHFNEVGSRRAAVAIAEWLLESGATTSASKR